MSLFMKQTETRSQLQEKLNTELQERAKKKALESERPDGVTDSAYLRNTKQTTSLAWAWVLIGIVIVGIGVWVFASLV